MIPTEYTIDDIVQIIPYKEPFKFVDKITSIDENHIEGYYYFHHNHDFYKGHFPGFPITPGVILIETMAQIGLVTFGLYLLTKTRSAEEVMLTCIPVLSSADVKFFKKVLPGEYVFVKAHKTLFRHGKLVCQVKLLNGDNAVVAEGTISGFIAQRD